MKLEKIILLAVTLTATSSAYAQYTSDALRFSQFENAVDARFGAMGGTKAAIGGDISSVYGNPGGLGMFSKSEFSFTPELNLNNHKITAYGSGLEGKSNYLDLSNVGVVFHTRTYKSGDTKQGLLSLNFGIGYQKRAQYKNKFSFGGTENGNGLGNFFAQESNNDKINGVPAEPLDLLSDVNYAAYYGFLTAYDSGTNPAYDRLSDPNATQTNQIIRSGGSSEVDFSVGTNFSNKLFIGASLGLASFNYSSIEETMEVGTYKDPDLANPPTSPYSAIYTRNFDTEGSGINLKLGMILKPTNELRIGLNFETPTWFNVSDNYSEGLNAENRNYKQSKSYPFEYNLSTPLKLNGGLAYFIGNKGFISADVGFADYSSVKFSSSDGSLDNDTEMDIKSLYQNTINYSVGGEYKLDKSFLLRAGFRSTGNPYKNLDDKDYTINSISAGVGYRFGNYYLDAAVINSNSNLNYSNYTLNAGNEPNATIDTRTNKIALTFGVRF